MTQWVYDIGVVKRFKVILRLCTFYWTFGKFINGRYTWIVKRIVECHMKYVDSNYECAVKKY